MINRPRRRHEHKYAKLRKPQNDSVIQNNLE